MTDARLPARIGAVLGSPGRALADADRLGGGLRDAVWTALLVTLCVRLADIERAFIGFSVTPLAVLKPVLGVIADELRVPVVVAVLAGVAITVLAGRGKRDPGRDAELGAMCLVPYFVVRAVFGMIDGLLPGRLARLAPWANDVASAVGLAWVLLLVIISVGVARARGNAPAAAPGGSVLRDRLAVTALAAVLGVAAVANMVMFARTSRVAPSFTLPRVDKPGSLALADLRGKVVLLDFWATWCQPCTVMAGPLRELYAEWQPRGVEFVGINSDGPGITVEEIRAHLKAHPAPYPIVLDDSDVGARYNVIGLPHMVVLDRSGAVRNRFTGVTTPRELAAALKRAAN